MRAMLVIGIVLLGGCGLYDGVNGYIYAWNKFEQKFVVEADLNKDGETTAWEMDEYKKLWLQEHGLTKREGWEAVYNKEGEKLSASEFADLFQ